VKVLITGSEGFIGKTLVWHLKQERFDCEIFTLDIQGQGSKHTCIDLNDEILPKIISKIDPNVVIHLAGNVSVSRSISDPMADFEMNLRGTLKLLLALQNTSCRNFVYTTSGGAIYASDAPQPHHEESATNPISPYGISKLASESYVRVLCKQSNIDWTALAISNCYGKVQQQRAGVIYEMWKGIQEGVPPLIRGRDSSRDFIHVSDVISAIVLAMQTPANSRLNISSNVSTKLADLLLHMQKILGTNLEPKFSENELGHIHQSQLDNTKAKLLLGWSPLVNLETGLLLSL